MTAVETITVEECKIKWIDVREEDDPLPKWNKPQFDRETQVIMGVTAAATLAFWFLGRSDFYLWYATNFATSLLADPNFPFWENTYENFMSLVFFFAVPFSVNEFYLKQGKNGEKLPAVGLKARHLPLGNWKPAIIIVAVLAPFIWFVVGPSAAANPAMRATYPLPEAWINSMNRYVLWECSYLIYYFGYEYMWRGFNQVTLQRKTGWFYAMLWQTLMTSLLHIEKPTLELISAIAIGPVFGFLGWKFRSHIFIMVGHILVGFATDYWCAMANHLF